MASISNKNPFDNVKWDITNRSTKIASKFLIACGIITAIGGLLALTAHGAIGTVGSDILIVGGGISATAGLVVAGLKIRDYREKKQAEKEFKKEQKNNLEQDMNDLRSDSFAVEKSRILVLKNREGRYENYTATMKKTRKDPEKINIKVAKD